MAVYDVDIEQTVRAIWDAMLDLPLERIDPQSCPCDPSITAVVVLDGDFDGAIQIGCGRAMALRITQAMFANDEQPSTEDISDALGEVANMIAGNLKSAFPGHTSVGLPIVAFRTDYKLAIPGARQVGLVCYLSDGESLRVALMQQEQQNS